MLYFEFLSFTYHGKWQTSDSSWEFRKIENENMKLKLLKTILVDEKLRKTTDLWVEIMNSINEKYRGNLVT